MKRLAAISVDHALVVLAGYLAMCHTRLELVPARPWLVFAWLWLVWPVSLLVHPGRSLTRVLVPTAIGLALLAPCATTIFAFTAWTIRGFAP